MSTRFYQVSAARMLSSSRTVAAADVRSRIRGCLLGGAVGDALGAGIEFSRLDEIRRRYGEGGIADYEHVYGRRGAITDDTQMTLFTAEALIRTAAIRNAGGTAQPLGALHRAYMRWLHTQSLRSAHPDFEDSLDGWLIRIPALHSQRAPGNTCLSAMLLAQPGLVSHPINDSKGCGGVMRAAPIGLFGERPFDIGCQSCAITHGHPSGYLAGGALAAIITEILQGTPPAQSIARVREVYASALAGEVEVAIDRAMEAAATMPRTAETLETLGGGWVAEEALAIAIWCTLVARDFTDGVRLAVNHSGDSDSTGSIVGNILGAALGEEAIEAHWLADLELREEITQVADDLFAARMGQPVDPERYPAH